MRSNRSDESGREFYSPTNSGWAPPVLRDFRDQKRLDLALLTGIWQLDFDCQPVRLQVVRLNRTAMNCHGACRNRKPQPETVGRVARLIHPEKWFEEAR